MYFSIHFTNQLTDIWATFYVNQDILRYNYDTNILEEPAASIIVSGYFSLCCKPLF